MEVNGLIQKKFAFLDEYLIKLEGSIKNETLKTFSENWEKQRLVERCLQVLVEILIDVSERIIALKGVGPAASAVEAVSKLIDLGILKSKEPYEDMVRFRNLVVHHYEKIDNEIMFKLAKERLADFRKFQKEVERYENW